MPLFCVTLSVFSRRTNEKDAFQTLTDERASLPSVPPVGAAVRFYLPSGNLPGAKDYVQGRVMDLLYEVGKITILLRTLDFDTAAERQRAVRCWQRAGFTITSTDDGKKMT